MCLTYFSFSLSSTNLCLPNCLPQYSIGFTLAHDDRLDAVCMAVAYWLDQMDRDEQVGADEITTQLLEQWLDPERGVMYNEDKDKRNIGRYNMIKNF